MRSDSPSKSVIPLPEPRRLPGPPSEPLFHCLGSRFPCTSLNFQPLVNPGPLHKPLVSSLELPVPLLNSRFHRRLPPSLRLNLHYTHPSSGLPIQHPCCTARIRGLTIKGHCSTAVGSGCPARIIGSTVCVPPFYTRPARALFLYPSPRSITRAHGSTGRVTAPVPWAASVAEQDVRF